MSDDAEVQWKEFQTLILFLQVLFFYLAEKRLKGWCKNSDHKPFINPQRGPTHWGLICGSERASESIWIRVRVVMFRPCEDRTHTPGSSKTDRLSARMHRHHQQSLVCSQTAPRYAPHQLFNIFIYAIWRPLPSKALNKLRKQLISLLGLWLKSPR